MEHSNHYEKVKLYYSMKLWDKGRVQNAVVKKWITVDEFQQITGEAYK